MRIKDIEDEFQKLLYVDNDMGCPQGFHKAPNIAAESLMRVTQILAIFNELFYKSAAVYFQSKTFF